MAKPKIVLTADRTLMSNYRGISLATFFGCAPSLDPNRDHNSFWYKILKNQVTPKVLFDFICNPIPHNNGVAAYAPYGLRKVEAGLLRDGFTRDEVVVAHPDHVEKFIGPETQVVGTYDRVTYQHLLVCKYPFQKPFRKRFGKSNTKTPCR